MICLVCCFLGPTVPAVPCTVAPTAGSSGAKRGLFRHHRPRSFRGSRIGRDKMTLVNTSISALDASTEGLAAYQSFMASASTWDPDELEPCIEGAVPGGLGLRGKSYTC